MKEKFTDRRFRDEDSQMIELCNSIIDRYSKSGFTLSLRQIFYQLVSVNAIPNSVQAYTSLGKLITDARMAGLVDWDSIVDRGRPYQQVTLWDSAADLVRSASKSFHFNRWKTQPYYIEVMVEKQALEGVLIPTCNDLGIGLTANKGYSSVTALYEASKRLLDALERGKKVCVFYLGDHDPSGVDMTRDIRERLATFCRQDVDVKRLALNKSQIEEMNLPPNPAKRTDSRANEYMEKHGDESWELDAIPPSVLASYVRNAVYRRLDVDAWKASLQHEAKCKVLLQAVQGALRKSEIAASSSSAED